MGKKGVSKYVNIFQVGDKFGKYRILNSEIKIDREAKVYCECECGDLNWVSCYSLLKRTSKGCLECNNRRKKDENPSWKGFENISGKYFSSIKRNAKKRNIIFDIDIQYFNEILVKQHFKCNLTGLDINFSHSKKNNYSSTASIDRIDSKKGYVKGNIQWIHKDVNLMKNHFNQDYFLNICEKITEQQKNRINEQ
jgi:hypothetical protein